MKLVIETQCMENYGDDIVPHWKFKGGSSYIVEDYAFENSVIAEADVEMLSGKVECDNPMFREYIIGWSVQGDDYLSQFEKDQLEFDGEITMPEPRLELN